MEGKVNNEVGQDGYGGDWEDDTTIEASERVDEDASGGSRKVILRSILAASSSRSSIGQGSDDGSLGSCWDHGSAERADCIEDTEEGPHAGGKDSVVAIDSREQGTRGCSRAEQLNCLYMNGKIVTCSDGLERGCAVDTSEEGLEDNRVHPPVEGINPGRSGHENTTSNSSSSSSSSSNHGNHGDHGNHGNHATGNSSKNTRAKPGHHHPEAKSLPALPDEPGGNHERGETTRSSLPPARWPNPQSVQLSRGYIFYACKAGDYVDERCSEGAHTRGGGGRRRGLLRRRRKSRQNKRPSRSAPSPQNRGSDTVVGKASRGATSHAGEDYRDDSRFGCDEEDGGNAGASAAMGRKLYDMGDNMKGEKCARRKQENRSTFLSKAEASTSKTMHARRRDGIRDFHQPNDKGSRSCVGLSLRGVAGGRDLSGGLPILEKDMRGAIVAVWLAWGVRIDATREKLRQEETWLRTAHRAEIAKLGRFSLAGGAGGKDNRGITPEVLECVAKEAALRDRGDSEGADRVRGEAMRARTTHFAERNDAIRYRRPLLEAALRQQQVAELLVVKSSAEKIESKLVRDRDEAVRLLQLHLSRARRLVSAGVAARATSCGLESFEVLKGGKPILLETDLLKLGKLLLLAQDTANDSIERALRTPGSQSGRCVRATIKGGATKTQPTRVSSPAQAEEVDAGPRSVRGNHAPSSSPSRDKIDYDVGSKCGAQGTKKDVEGPPQGPHSARDAASAPLRPRRPHVRVSTGVDTTTATGRVTCCLWCNPAPTDRQQRRQDPMTGIPLQRRDNWRSIDNFRPYARSARRNAAEAQRNELLPERHGPLPASGGYSPTSNRYSRLGGGSHARLSKPRRKAAGKSTAGVQLHTALPPRGNAANDTETAAANVFGTASGLDHFCSPKDLLFDGEHRLSIRGGCGFPPPQSFFCSWECAGRWNASFSPAQTRHERGTKIDIAAGMIVPT